MSCKYQIDKSGATCCGGAIEGSDFCWQHVMSDQNSCTHTHVKTVDGWDAKNKSYTKQKMHVQCGKMRQAGSVYCPHHTLTAEYDSKKEKKTTAERLGGYSK